ncbi:MAG: PHP domain-containing protein, partial [Lactobacillus iners]|nr:PHP domain-containing protein [Lactobacillus iners]
MEIAGLQNISSFTLLKSPISIEQLIGSAKKRGYKAIALTDINFTYGLIDFYKMAKSEGIKPLLGMQLRINGLINENQNFDLIVIAKNNVGYQNIMRLSSAVNLITENGKKEIDVTLNKLQKYLGNLH